MPQTQATKGSGVRVIITNKGNWPSRHHANQHTFGDAEALLQEFLESNGETGLVNLAAIGGRRGSGVKRICFILLDDAQSRIKLTLQPGSNDTAWEYWATLPDGNLRAFYERLRPLAPSWKGRKGRRERGPALVPTPPSPPPVADVSAGRRMDPVVEYLKSPVMIAMSLCTLFPRRDSNPSVSDVEEILQGEMVWSREQAHRAYQGLVNRNYLKEGMVSGVKWVMLANDGLCTHLNDLGAAQKPPPAKTPSSATAVFSGKAADRTALQSVRVGDRLPAATSSLRKSAKPSSDSENIRHATHQLSPTPATVPAMSQSPGAKGFSSTNKKFEDLYERGRAFETAQEALRTTAPAVAALQDRRARLVAELTQVDQSLAEQASEHARALGIVSDPSYSGAATKLAQIKALIED